ncbi:hypothetical protein KW803_03875, partial [Candidatus Saccharibacteria bacterium]|nr:hypothetical protein [Candidatus Saccharibacteria bacterium]
LCCAALTRLAGAPAAWPALMLSSAVNIEDGFGVLAVAEVTKVQATTATVTQSTRLFNISASFHIEEAAETQKAAVVTTDYDYSYVSPLFKVRLIVKTSTHIVLSKP